MSASDKLILGIAGALLAVGLGCLAALTSTDANTANVIQTGMVMAYLGVASVVVGFLVYPSAKAEADCRREHCEGDADGDH